MKYAALMFDIVESRHYQGRYDIQNTLMNAVSYLNHLYREDIKKEVVSSAGDEFQVYNLHFCISGNCNCLFIQLR